MEPISSSAIALTLAKSGAGAATGPLTALLKKRTLRWRVARSVSKAANSLGIQIRRKDLRQWLARADVQKRLALGGSGDVSLCIQQLELLFVSDQTEASELAHKLLKLILDEYLRAQSPSDAAVLSTNRIEGSIEAGAEATRRAVRDELAAPQLFAEDLRRLHPWRRELANEIASRWTPIRDLVHSIVTQSDRGEVLRIWAKEPPTPLETGPAEAWCWLGLLAADYGESLAATSFIRQGIQSGATPGNYWRARLALDGGDVEYARSLLQESEPTHPMAAAQVLLADGHFIETDAMLATWHPQDPNDRSIKAILLSASAAGQGDLNGCIAIGIESSKIDPEGSGIMLRTAEALLSRGHFGSSDHPLTDFAQARALAIRVRDSRREWLGDSVAAVLVAIKASALSADIDRAWRLTLRTPDGEATDEEVADPRLRRESALLAATMGNTEYARTVAAAEGDPFTTAAVNGWVQLNSGQPEAATASWMKAWEAAPDDYAKLQMAAALAPLGAQMPDLHELEGDQAESVAKLRAIHEVMSAGDDKLALLRARASESEQLTVLLAEQLDISGASSEAAAVLEDGANRWNHPLMMRMAADHFMRAGLYSKAAEAAISALSMGGTNWAGALDAMGIRFDALEAQGLLNESLQVARQMAAAEPSNLNVRWTLVHCLIRRGDLKSAWKALTPQGHPVRPRGAIDARAWITLSSEYDMSPLFVNRALTEMRRWTDDPNLMGIYLAQIYSGLTRHSHQISDADLAILHSATKDYTTTHPDSHIFRMMKVGPDDDPLAPIEPSLRLEAEHPSLVDIRTKVSLGELPLGCVAAAFGRSYAEVSIKRAAGLVFHHTPVTNTTNGSVVDSLNRTVAIDVTAAVTLALLDPRVVDLLIGAFQSIETTDRAFHDSLAAQQNLQLRSTVSISWNTERQQPMVVEISDLAAERLARHADTTTQILTRANRRGWPALNHFTGIRPDTAWLSAIDFAISSQLSFWCDDRVMRCLAAQKGIATFGTVDLLRHLVGLC